MSVRIIEDDTMPENGRVYIFQDVADLFWPDDFSKSNHAAQDKIIARMKEKGCKALTHSALDTPAGLVRFDSESGGFNCFASHRGPVEYVAEVIRELQAELDAHREALR